MKKTGGWGGGRGHSVGSLNRGNENGLGGRELQGGRFWFRPEDKLAASLLPGLRDIRAPLAAGYMWLFVAWLWFGTGLPKESQSRGVLRSIYELGDVISVFGAGVALSFAAYVIGSLSEAVTRVVLSRGASLIVAIKTPFTRRRMRPTPEDLAARGSQHIDDDQWSPARIGYVARRLEGRISVRALRDLEIFIREWIRDLDDRLSKRDMSVADVLERNVYDPSMESVKRGLSYNPLERILDEVSRDLDLVATRLISVNAELYAQYDRLRAESEFRFVLVAPGLALAFTLALTLGPLWVLSIVGFGFLYADGVRLREESGDVLAGALRAQAVPAPMLERLELRARELLEEDLPPLR